MAKTNRKKNNIALKTTGIVITCCAGATLIFGGLYHAIPAVHDWVQEKLHGTQQAQAKELTTSYSLIGNIMGDEMVVRGYYGDSNEFALPKTVSIGELVSYRYNFNDVDELFQYYDTVYQRYSHASDWDGDMAKERFNYTFISANDTLYNAKSIEELQNICSNIMSLPEEEKTQVFPMRHDGLIQSYKEGKDITITRIEKLGDNVSALHVPAGIDINYRQLASQGIELSFDRDHEDYGTWVSKNGCLIDTQTQTLKYVYPCELENGEYTTAQGLKAIDFSAFNSLKNTLKTLYISEGVLAVSGTLDANETNQRLVINMPNSLQTINSDALVMRFGARNNVVIYLNSLATSPRGVGVYAYSYAASGYERPTYILTDELYNQLITEQPEFRDSPFAEQLVSYSIYLARN